MDDYFDAVENFNNSDLKYGDYFDSKNRDRLELKIDKLKNCIEYLVHALLVSSTVGAENVRARTKALETYTETLND